MRSLRGTALKRFLRDWRRAHPPEVDLALVLQSVSYPVNVGSLFRIADAARVSHLYLCGATPTPPNLTIAKVGRAKEHNVPWAYEHTAEEAIAKLKQEHYTVFALELTENARPYYAVDYEDRVCLVLGNEDHGITRSVLELCDHVIFIPMYGKGQSLNVHVSAAVVLYHVLHPMRE